MAKKLGAHYQPVPLYRELASRITARNNCIESNNQEWEDRHETIITQLVDDFFPSGSGFDAGSTIDKGKSDTLRIHTSFHAMADNGMYDRWIDITITVKPSLLTSIELIVKGDFGRDYQGIKDHVYEAFDEALRAKIIWNTLSDRYIQEWGDHA